MKVSIHVKPSALQRLYEISMAIGNQLVHDPEFKELKGVKHQAFQLIINAWGNISESLREWSNGADLLAHDDNIKLTFVLTSSCGNNNVTNAVEDRLAFLMLSALSHSSTDQNIIVKNYIHALKFTIETGGGENTPPHLLVTRVCLYHLIGQR